MPAGADLGYEKALGRRLRAIRRQKHLSLEQVEAATAQEFRAGALGAYERGERTISVPRLQRLARFYGVPVDRILPRDDPEDRTDQAGDGSEADGSAGNGSAGPGEPTLVIDLPALERLQAVDAASIRDYIRMIQLEREDFNGRILSLRRGDVRMLGHLLRTRPEQARHRLERLGVLGAAGPETGRG